jgi:hypothetical protein
VILLNRASTSALAEKEKAIAQKILQVLAEENLTNGEARYVLEYAKCRVNDGKFICPENPDCGSVSVSKNHVKLRPEATVKLSYEACHSDKCPNCKDQ